MPPQQTDPASRTGSDAAVRGLAVSALDVLSLLTRYWRAFGRGRQRLNSRTSLHELSDRELKDIGVTREEIDHIAPHRAIDALRSSFHSRGVI
jgi:uncharacterized protein YjiS (DUF1127 family)